MPPLVGVFIPTYNSAPFLDDAIQSVLNQTFTEFEMLILDDASSDNTAAVLEKYNGHSKIRIVRNDSNLGMSRNWNKGVSLLANKYIAKLDADDYYHPDFLNSIVPVLDNNPDVGLVFTATRWISSRVWDELPYTESWVVPGKIFLRNLTKQFTLHSPTILVRRECYTTLGSFVEHMRIHADWEMWTRIASNFDIAYVSRVLSYFRRHNDNCTSAARKDTRTPDDFTIWLRLLDEGGLPYQLSKVDRKLLELKMIQIVHRLMQMTIRESSLTAKACLRFLLKSHHVPVYEKVRYNLALSFLQCDTRLALTALRGSRWTKRLWSSDKELQIQLPTRNPYTALGINDGNETF